MLEANSKLDASMTRLLRLGDGAETEIEDIYRQLETRVRADLARMSAGAEPAISRFAYLRYAGQGHDIRVDLPPFPMRAGYAAEIAARFEAAYLAKYGYRQPGAVVEAVDWYIVATVASASAGAHRAKSWRSEASGSFRRGTRKAYFPEAGGFVDCAVIDRSALPVGEIIEGPAIIEDADATTRAAARLDTASVSPRGAPHHRPWRATPMNAQRAADPDHASVLWNGLLSIAEEMGTTLRHDGLLGGRARGRGLLHRHLRPQRAA